MVFLQWFDLEEVATGKLHLRLEWLSLYPSAEKLDQVYTRTLTDGRLDETLAKPLIMSLSSSVLLLGYEDHKEE